MALNAENLKQELEDEIRAKNGLGATPYPDLTKFCESVATTIVNHLKNNAELNNASFSGTYGVGTTSGGGSVVNIVNQAVTGGIK